MTREHDHHNLGGSNRLLNVAEAAELLNVPQSSLRNRRKAWGIPCLKTGRSIKFRERDLHAWMARQAEEVSGPGNRTS